MKGLLLDVDYAEEGEKPCIRLFLKSGGETLVAIDPTFEQYLYVTADDAARAAKLISKLDLSERGRILKPKSVEPVKRSLMGREVDAVRVVFHHPADMPPLRHAIRELPGIKEIYGFDIPSARRYLVDRGLAPMSGVSVRGKVEEGDDLKTLFLEEPPKPIEIPEGKMNVMSFDIEVYNPAGTPRPDKDPAIMISMADDRGFKKVITWKDFKAGLDYVEVVGSEREMLQRFVEVVGERDVDILLGYNTDLFDFPYLRERAKQLKVKLGLGRDGSEVITRKRRFATAARIRGRVHLDVYAMVNFLATIGTIRLIHYTLEDVYRHMLGKEKPEFEFTEMVGAWERGGEQARKFLEYSMSDAQATLELGLELLPLFFELTRIVRQTPFDVTRMTPGQLVEWLLIAEAHKGGELVPARPVGEEYRGRLEETYVGAYVMEPVKGLHENLVEFDFRCHPGDTEVITPSGPKRISEVKEGDEVLGLFGWEEIAKVHSYDYTGPFVGIKTEDGKGLRATQNHLIPVKIPGKRTGMEEIPAGNLSKNREIFAFKDEDIPVSVREQKIALLCGIFHAEGNALRRDIEYWDKARGRKRISKQYRLTTTCNVNEKELQEATLEGIREINPNAHLLLKNSESTKKWDVIVSQKRFYEKFMGQYERFLRGEADKRSKASFLRGFFEGDGGLNTYRGTIQVSQSYKNNRKLLLVTRFLRDLGIDFNYFTKSRPTLDNPNGLCRLEIARAPDILAFAARVGFLSRRKKRLLKQVVESRFTWRGKSFWPHEQNRIYSPVRIMNMSVEHYEGKVYDLTLKNTRAPYYFANGILTHNSLYPSIIVSHNIDPSTFNCKCCKPSESTLVPEFGYHFCRKRKGFIPATLERLIEARAKLKRELKRHKRGTREYRSLDARQWALKIVANSFYGMLGYPRARWYFKECAESVTSFGRHYIHKTIEAARDFGFEVIYGDTDGLYCKLNGKKHEDALRFLKRVNEGLPGIMELEFEGFYPRGVFVTKKRYAMIDEEGRMVVKGLEFVRRDWAALAKKTQEGVLRAILKDGSPKKAAEIVRRTTREVLEGKVSLEDLIIYTQLKMPIESYRSIGPHVVAAKKLRAKGHVIEPGMIIAYIEAKGPGSISERAVPVEEFKGKEYDADYYVEHQILPAVMRIMEVLGYRGEDLRYAREKQVRLTKFMGG